jgi:hypothetical protein
MGSFVETAWSCVKWIGNCIYRVISWWGEFMAAVNSFVHGFLMLKRAIIERSDNPKGVGEIVAIEKEKDQLDEKAKETYNTLSQKDKDTVDELLANRNY